MDYTLAKQLKDAGFPQGGNGNWDAGGASSDDISCLRVAARYIKNGTVKFPRTGCEHLLTQLLGFGREKHDDAVDALVYLILGLAGDGIEEPKVHYV